jgi:catechol 2,3-dioxygenase-like lactoylglutathione lyase family enzyme
MRGWHTEQGAERLVSDEGRPRITKVAAVVVPVTDQARARTFYVEKLGFDERLDVELGDGDRWIEVAPAGADTTIALRPAKSRRVRLVHGVSGELARAPEGEAGIETGIRLATGDIHAEHARLRARGVDVDDIRQLAGVPSMFSIRDPDGNTLVVVQRD